MPGRDPTAMAMVPSAVPGVSSSMNAPISHSQSSESDDAASAAVISRGSSSLWSTVFTRPGEGSPSHSAGAGPSASGLGIVENERASAASHVDHPHPALALGPPLLNDRHRSGSQPDFQFSASYSETPGEIRDNTALLSDMLLSPNSNALLSPPIYQHPHSLGHNQTPPPPTSSVAQGSTPSRGRPPFRFPPDTNGSQGLQQAAVPWTRPLMAHLNPPASSSSPMLLSSQAATSKATGVTTTSSSSSTDDTSPPSSSGGKTTPKARPEPQPPVSPVGGGRSILTMLLDRERERQDSVASERTLKAPEATSSTQDASQPESEPAVEGAPSSTPSPPRPGSVSSVKHIKNHSPPRKRTFSPPAHVRTRSSSSATPSNPQVSQTNARAPRSVSRARRKIGDEEEGTPLLEENGLGSENEVRDRGYGATSTSSAQLTGNGYASSYSASSPQQHFLSLPPPASPKPTSPIVAHVSSAFSVVSSHLRPKAIANHALTTVEILPAVLLGSLLNILDGVSYGFIMFPAGAVFAGFGGLGVSMFFLTTAISQLVYALGGSSFPGATGSMIIEVIPFFHMMAAEITATLGGDDGTPERAAAIISSTMVAFALSSILTGLAFLIFGLLKLGSVIGFFPRHILVGCIGGVGAFLILTGLNVAAGMGEEEADLSWRLLKIYFTDTRVLTLWIPAFLLAVLVRVITHRYQHQLIFPAYFVALPALFYVIVYIGGFKLDDLRQSGWIFDVGDSNEPWYKFYTYFDFRKTSWSAVWNTMPTQLALLFFNVLHPPLNVPALGVSLNKDEVDLSHELTGHGVSNLLAGLFGVPANYLAYVNTLLFYRVGGTTRYSGLLLALATFGLLLIGTGPIGYIPVIEVGALIFVLGIDLVKEAVWDTWPRASRSEYITIIGIMLCMTVYDFVSGVIFGIILASIFFVIQNSRRTSIQSVFYGSTALSTVRRPSAHRKYLQEVGTQTCVIRLQGHIFFGTIAKVEETCRSIVDQHAWEQNPIRFLVIDLALVPGLDLSAAEAFVRVQRLLVSKGVILVFCGQDLTSEVAVALRSVGLWSGNVEVFATLNDALEWTENAYLRAWYSSPTQKPESRQRAEEQPISARLGDNNPFYLGESFVNSPRRSQVQAVGSKIMDAAAGVHHDSVLLKEQPYNTFLKTFSSHDDLTEEFVVQVAPYFKPVIVASGEIIYRQGDTPDALYLIESGVLRASYHFGPNIPDVVESCVAGTLCGELTALAGEPRNATVVAERQSVLWKLSTTDLTRLQNDHPVEARLFVKLVLKTSKIDHDVLLTNLAQLRT